MSYENAPATTLVATRCACCSRPLVDAVSVEAGVGPECRRRHGYAEAQGPFKAERFSKALEGLATLEEINGWFVEGGPRKAANVLVHRIACAPTAPETLRYLIAIEAAGFSTLANAVAKNLGAVVVNKVGGYYEVSAPYNETFRFGVWDREKKIRRCPVESRSLLWAAIVRSFPKGTLVRGERGLKEVV